MESSINAVLQIIVKSSQIFYRNKIVNFSQEQFEELTKKLPAVWWNDKDRIVYFTYYDDGSYFCEREKFVYDYSLKQEVSKIYEFNVLSKEEAKELATILQQFFEELRIEELKTQKELLREEIKQNFDYISVQFRDMRNKLLDSSDWTQLPDVVEKMDPKEASLWKIYRQYLRDMPNSDAWQNSEYINIEFPTPPDKFLKISPDEEYLSSRKHFQNIVTLAARDYLYEIIRTLTMPSLTEELKKMNDEISDYDSFGVLIDMTNEKLAEISTDLKIEINVVEATP